MHLFSESYFQIPLNFLDGLLYADPGNANPNRVLPLDVARACQKELDFGALLDEYPVTVGNVTAVKSAEKYGHEMGLRLQEKGVQGIVLTST